MVKSSVEAKRVTWQELIRRLAANGFDKSYLYRKVLPAWWNSRIANTPAGFQQGALLLSRFLGLDYTALLEGKVEPSAERRQCLEVYSIKHKLRYTETADSVQVATQIACQAAELLADLLIDLLPVRPLASVPSEIREELLGQYEQINFNTLLNFCWEHGIPVLHISTFPKNAHKPDALVVQTQTRPVIVLCQRKGPAWLLFHLAHELAHLSLGHLQRTAIRVDNEVKTGSDDSEEEMANNFALEFLTDSQELQFAEELPFVKQLTTEALKIGAVAKVDPGLLVLEYGYRKSNWKLVQSALKRIEKLQEPSTSDPPKLIVDQIRRHIPSDDGFSDIADYLMRITAAENRCALLYRHRYIFKACGF
jgi:Zn-dependent peptidase ImmA (M78 family)